MSWQILIFISVLLSSVSVLLQRVLLRDEQSRPVAYSIFFQYMVTCVTLVVGIIVTDLSFPGDWSGLIWNLALMALLYGFFNVFVFKSLKFLEASKFSIILSARLFFTVLASSLLLGEFLNTTQFVGSLLIFAAVVLVNYSRGTKFSLDKGSLFALAAAVCFGLANTNDRYLLRSFELFPYLIISFLIPSVLMSGIYFKELKFFKLFLRRDALTKVVVLSVSYAFAALTFFAALQKGDNSSQVASVGLTSVVLTVLMATVFLKERENLGKKFIGAGLSLLGLLLLT